MAGLGAITFFRDPVKEFFGGTFGTGRGAAWLARLLGVQEVRGSNPRAPTTNDLVVGKNAKAFAFFPMASLPFEGLPVRLVIPQKGGAVSLPNGKWSILKRSGFKEKPTVFP